MKIKFWIHERLHRIAVYLLGAKTFFRFQCFCGASVLKQLPRELAGGAFARGGTFDITPSHGTVVAVDCDICHESYELVWNGNKEQFSIARDFGDFIPRECLHVVKAEDGSLIADGVSFMAAKKYQQANAGSTIEQK